MEERTFSDISFEKYLDEDRLMGSQCKKCNEVFLPPRPICIKCHSPEMKWVEMETKGRLSAVRKEFPQDYQDATSKCPADRQKNTEKPCLRWTLPDPEGSRNPTYRGSSPTGGRQPGDCCRHAGHFATGSQPAPGANAGALSQKHLCAEVRREAWLAGHDAFSFGSGPYG